MTNNTFTRLLFSLLALAAGGSVLASHGGGRSGGAHRVSGGGGRRVPAAPPRFAPTGGLRARATPATSTGLYSLGPRPTMMGHIGPQPIARVAPGYNGGQTIPALSPPQRFFAGASSARQFVGNPAPSLARGEWGNHDRFVHAGFVRGYWNRAAFSGGNSIAGGAGWGFGSGLGLGTGLGYGLSSWLYGPALSNWGYSNYANPYYSGGYGLGSTPVNQQPAPYDYSRPINSSSQPASETAATQAVALFDQGRDAFKAENYAQALALCDQALRILPDDPVLHEFRAVTLFALQRYDEAAAVLYAVLTAGPGWDWTTLISVYSNPETFAQQLRALEQYCIEQPDHAPARFVLAYLYMTEGHTDAALRQFQQIASLQPKDEVSAQMIARLAPPPGTTPSTGLLETSSTAPTAAADPTPAISPAGLDGTWTAQPRDDTSINVQFTDGGRFLWTVRRPGNDEQFEGRASWAGAILTLSRDESREVLVGTVDWHDGNTFEFRVLGAGPGQPGLSFTRAR